MHIKGGAHDSKAESAGQSPFGPPIRLSKLATATRSGWSHDGRQSCTAKKKKSVLSQRSSRNLSTGKQTCLQTARARRAPGMSGRASQAVAQASPQAARRDVRRETAQISRGFARDDSGRRVRQTRTPGDAFVARPARCSGGGGARRDWKAPMVDGGRRSGFRAGRGLYRRDSKHDIGCDGCGWSFVLQYGN